MRRTFLAVFAVLFTVCNLSSSYSAPSPTPTPSSSYLGSRQAMVTFAKPTKPAIAILDVGFDTTLSAISKNTIYEVCILEWPSCPNGKDYMEGPGSSQLIFKTAPVSATDQWAHGTLMAGVAATSNPNVNLVLVRIIGRNSAGDRQVANSKTVTQALDWVFTNKDKLNIQAVTMSQGHHNLTNLSDYCPSTPDTRNSIINLVNAGVPVFFSVGNGRDYSKIDWPSCIPESLAIGMTDQYDQIDNMSNYDINRIDFFALGNVKAQLPGGAYTFVAGTSASAQMAASKWLIVKSKNPTAGYDDIYKILKSSALTVKGTNGKQGLMINVK
jgi:hypothetical protein